VVVRDVCGRAFCTTGTHRGRRAIVEGPVAIVFDYVVFHAAGTAAAATVRGIGYFDPPEVVVFQKRFDRGVIGRRGRERGD